MRHAPVHFSAHFSFPVFALLTFSMAACVTTQDRFTRAFEAEQEGNLYRAAQAYAEVIRRDPDFRDARVRFDRTARAAADTLYAQARVAERAAHYDRAVDRLDDLHALRMLAGEFGLLLPLPPDHDAFYDAMNEAAVRALLDAAARDVARRRYAEAETRYDRALRYTMPAALRSEVDHRRTSTLLDWAAHSLAQGTYQRAYKLAERVRGLDPAPALLQQAEDLQREALDAGTEVVAFLPVLPAETASDAPLYWSDALTRALGELYWSTPPLFVAAVPPGVLRRELGRMGRRAPFTRAEAVGIGRAAEADLVLVPALQAYTRTERNRTETLRSVKTRAGQDTTYTEIRYELVLEVTVAFRLIETTSRNVIAEERVPVRVVRPMHVATFTGDVSTLRLPSPAVRDLFDADAQRQSEADLDIELQEEVASTLAEAVFNRVLAFVP